MVERERARRAFIAEPDTLAALHIDVEDLADYDTRMLAIEHEHPEFAEALADGVDEIDGPNGPVNPRIHLAMHEVVATQLWNDDPPEVWDTAVRLLDAGYDRHEVLHMLAGPMTTQVWEALRNERAYDRERHIADLRALPGSWERERVARTAELRHDAERKKARRSARAARRRNRRPH